MVGVLLCAACMTWGSFFFERAAIFSEGMENCFGRLRRSYMSALLGDRGILRAAPFLRKTETCFSETVSFMEQHFSPSLVKDLAPINSLVKDVHWFHKDLRQSGDPISLRNRFEKLEDAHGGIGGRLEAERKKWGRLLEASRILLVALGGMGVIGFLLSFWRARMMRLKKKRPVLTSRPELEKGPPFPGLDPVSLEDVLMVVLDSLADKILLQGIRVEPHIEENSQVYAREASLLQTLEVLFNHIFNSYTGEGRVGIFEEDCGERTALVLDSFLGETLGNYDELMFSNLILESGGRMEQSSPGQMRISFGRVVPSERTVVPGGNRLIKGKKKEILRQLSSLENPQDGGQ